MAHLYEITDDDVVAIDPPTPSSSKSADPAKQSSPRKPASKEGRRNTRSNALAHDVEMRPPDEDVKSPSSSSSSRASAGTTGEDVKMEDTATGANETTAEDKKQMEVTQLPNSDKSPPVHPQQPQSTSNDASSSSSSAPALDVKAPSPPPDAVAAGAAAAAGVVDEKSKKPASASVKPKSTKRRSPSPEPLPRPTHVQTIRLEIPLGGPEKYAVSIMQLAKETGQRPPTPPPPLKHDTNSSESEAEAEDSVPKGKGRGKAGRKSTAAEYYDLEDPFIDDSELAIDERTFFAQTKQQGFYVSSGEVALLKDKSRDKEIRELEGMSPAKKPKSKRNLIPTIIPLAGSQAANAAVASSTGISTASSASRSVPSPTDPFGSQLTVPHVHGTREVPITLSDNEESKPPISALQPINDSISANGIVSNGSTSALKRKSSESSTNGKKKRRTVEIESFHPELQAALHELKHAIALESFEQKGKFPVSLKPILARVALKAISVGEYNDHFFSLMPKLFIYNKFTMTKLIKRTVYADHQKLLMERQDELLRELAQIASDGFERAKEEYEKSVSAWERRQEKSKAGVASVEGTPGPSSDTPSVNGGTLPPPTQDNGADSGMELEGAPPSTQTAAAAAGGAGDKDKDKDKDREGGGHVHSSMHMPIQRYRLTERMRNIIWELVWLSNESVKIENEKNTLENSAVQVSEQGTRKQLYQKVVAAFPEGWMSSGQISREVSVMKKRYEAQQAEGLS